MEQGTTEWVTARLGYVSASNFFKLGRKSVMTQTAETYMHSLISEHLTGKPSETVKTYAMEWGTKWEPVAREAYQRKTGNVVTQVGFETHGSEEWVGCSPDGLVLDSNGLENGAIEIKAPLTPANHARVIVNGEMPDEHREQVQGVLWITGSRWCDFVSYHDDFPDRWRLLVVRVERDDQYISELSRRVIAFRDEMVTRLNSIIERWEK